MTGALKEATGAELVYVYVFGGGIPHLHVHLGPHRDGDALNDHIIRGEVTYEPQPSGAMRIVSHDLPAEEIEGVIERARRSLAREMQTGDNPATRQRTPNQR